MDVKKAIEDKNAALRLAYNRGDSAGCVAVLVEDAVTMPLHEPIVRGKKAVRELIQGWIITKGENPMNRKSVMVSMAVVTVTALFILGCAGSFGRLKVEEGGMTLDTLVHDWQQYNVYSFGTTSSNPVAVLFDPKNDGKNLEVEGLRWQSIRDESTVRDMVGRVGALSAAVPRLFKIVAPDDSIYGYVYTPALTLDITVVNENTMRVGS